eukprot:scaffold35103_cov84-Isochrysis_galbana.AAC.2
MAARRRPEIRGRSCPGTADRTRPAHVRSRPAAPRPAPAPSPPSARRLAGLARPCRPGWPARSRPPACSPAWTRQSGPSRGRAARPAPVAPAGRMAVSRGWQAEPRRHAGHDSMARGPTSRPDVPPRSSARSAPCRAWP